MRTFESFVRRLPKEDADRTKIIVFDAMRDPKPFAYDHRVILEGGEVRMIHTRGDVIVENGVAIRVLGSCMDMTDRWEATQRLERTLSLQRATLDATADGILVVDRAGRVVAYNQKFLTMWRIPSELAEKGDDRIMLAAILPASSRIPTAFWPAFAISMLAPRPRAPTSFDFGTGASSTAIRLPSASAISSSAACGAFATSPSESACFDVPCSWRTRVDYSVRSTPRKPWRRSRAWRCLMWGTGARSIF